MNKRNVQIAGLGCGFLIVCVLTAGIFWQLNGRSETESTNQFVSITVEAPESAVMGEPFSIVISVFNFSFDPGGLTVHSVDFSDSYLDGVDVVQIKPSVERDFSVPLAGFHSFLLRHPIETDDTAVIEFIFESQQAAELTGVMDVCINTASLCQRFNLQTAVVAE